MRFRRREFIAGAMAMPMASSLAAQAVAGKAPDDETYWAGIAAQYDVTREVIQLENAYWGVMARPVMAAYAAQVERVNRESSYYARRNWATDMGAVRARVAAKLGVGPDEIVLTRNATEALKGLIGGYNRLKPGDRVLHADLDYDSTLAAMASLERLRGVTVRRIALPEPATYQGVIDAYEAAFRADPGIRLVLLTHLSHRTGLVLPIREIVALARARGIDAIVDAAHSWGQLDFVMDDLGADFVGLNLHKWWGAPLGVGAMVVRKGRLDAIDRDIASDPGEGIDTRVHTGTVDFAAALTVPAALDFQDAIGGPARAGRLRYLRDRWAEEARGVDGVEILTPPDPRMHGGITSFRLRGLTTTQDNMRLVQTLLEQYKIFTVHRPGVAKGACIRVSPALFTAPADVDALAAALQDLASKMKR